MISLLTLIFAALLHTGSAHPWGSNFIGVNVGGWLVLESWITPSLYSKWNVTDGVGEWEFCETLGPKTCATALQEHWDSWVAEDDLSALASAGITALRVPVGYWILPQFINPGEPYQGGGWTYLTRLLGWARKTGLKVVVDLHGAPGSQNGHDNSGRTGPIQWMDGDNINRTTSFLEALATELLVLNSSPSTEGVVIGIELLNEPWTPPVGGPIPMATLAQFYETTITSLRSIGWTGDIWISDGWNLTYWETWAPSLNSSFSSRLFLDTHNYYCFGGGQPSPWSQVGFICDKDAPRLQGYAGSLPIIVGEWSSCIVNLPSFPLDASGQAVMTAIAESQQQAYGSVGPSSSTSSSSSTAGSFFWNFKTEGSWPWDYLAGIKGGWIPTLPSPPITNGSFPGGADSPFLDCSVFTSPFE